MITMTELYLFTRLDGLRGLILAVAVVTAMIAALSCILNGIYLAENGKPLFSWNLIAIPIVSIFILSFACVLIPTTKEAAFIYIVPKIANSKFAQEIPSDMHDIKDLAMQYIRENLKTEPEKP